MGSRGTITLSRSNRSAGQRLSLSATRASSRTLAVCGGGGGGGGGEVARLHLSLWLSRVYVCTYVRTYVDTDQHRAYPPLSLSLSLSRARALFFGRAPAVRVSRDGEPSGNGPMFFTKADAINFNIIAYCWSNWRKVRVTAAWLSRHPPPSTRPIHLDFSPPRRKLRY